MWGVGGGGVGVQQSARVLGAPPAAVTRTGRLMDETGRGPSMLNLERFEFKELGFIFSHGLNREGEKFKFSMTSVFLMAEEIYIS